MNAELEFDKRVAAGQKPSRCEIDEEGRALLCYLDDAVVIGDWHEPGVIQVMAKLAERSGWGDRKAVEKYLQDIREFGVRETEVLPGHGVAPLDN